jgi:hypothetical protein
MPGGYGWLIYGWLIWLAARCGTAFLIGSLKAVPSSEESPSEGTYGTTQQTSSSDEESIGVWWLVCAIVYIAVVYFYCS